MAQTSTPDQDTAEANGPQLEDIIVTAQRTDQRLQEVPISVIAVTSENLDARGISTSESLTNAVPGLQVNRYGSTVTPYLRGVGALAGSPNQENSVATYIDGIYIASPSGGLTAFNNIDRIEVLKGPQGTLFGRNATGGVIQIITRTPEHTLSGDFEVGYGNYDTVNAGVYVTGGLSNTIAADLAVQYRNQGDGFGQDLINGEDTYKGKEFGARSKILWEPSATTSITLAGDYNDLVDHSANYVFAEGGVVPLNPGQVYAGRYATSTNLPSRVEVETYGASLTISQDLGFAELVSLSARRIMKGLFRFDRDSTPLPILSFDTPLSNKTWSQEVQLISTGNGPLSWTVGAFYYDMEGGYVPARLIGLAVGPTPDSSTFIRGVQNNESVSVYAQATYEILPELQATGGIRYTSEKIRIDYDVSADGVFLFSTGDKTSFEKPTWRLALDYEFVSDVHAYVSYNRGIKSGGFEVLSPFSPPYKPEILDAYEFGIKSELLNRRLRLNLAAFYYDYQDIQVSSNPGTTILTTNAAEATIKGFEGDFEAAVTDDFRLSGGFAVLRGEFGDFPTPSVFDEFGVPVVLPNADGNTTGRTPRFTANLLATYTRQTSIGEFGLTGSFAHNSGYFFDPDNRIKAPGYDLFGASVSWTDPSDRYTIRVWGENLTDEEYLSQFSQGGGIGDTYTYAPPRTYGVTLSGRF
ncbi:TonB-dependent receptor [Aurantiacibacter rhizosphaerae]|nr:TonB-dependent receptor [Aurantiacibacter rhizosphaerae]